MHACNWPQCLKAGGARQEWGEEGVKNKGNKQQ